METDNVRHDGLAIASLVLSLLWLGGIGAILGIIFGAVSRRDARRENRPGDVMASAGIVLGVLGLVLGVVLIAVIVAAHQPPNPTQQFINCSQAQVNGTPLPSYCGGE